MKLVKVDNNYKLDDFEQELPNGLKVFDFNKIYKSNYYITLIMSQRGLKGKTYNAKAFSYKMWKEHKYQTIWLRNMVKQINNEKTKFLQKKDTPPDMWTSSISGQPENNNVWVNDENNEPYIKLQSLVTATDEKGTRVLYKLLFFDEFNVGSDQVKNPIIQFDDLLHSTEDIVNDYGKEDKLRIFFFGNNLSLNNPLIYNLGVTHIENEITTFNLYDETDPNYEMKMVLVIFVKPSAEQKDQFDKDNKYNQRYQFSKMIGTAGHSYFNESLYDEVNFVFPLFKNAVLDMNFLDRIIPENVFRIEGEYFIVSRYKDPKYRPIYEDVDSKGHVKRIEILWHVISIKSIQKIYKELNIPFKEADFLTDWIYTSDPKEIQEGINQVPRYAINEIRKGLAESLVSFEDIHSRELFMQFIR